MINTFQSLKQGITFIAVRNFALLMLLLIVNTTNAQVDARPPAPPPANGSANTYAGDNLMGIGMKVTKMGKKMILVGAIESSPAAASNLFNTGCTGDIQLLSIINSSRGITLTVNKKTTLYEVLDALIGSEGTGVELKTKCKGVKGAFSFTVDHYFVNGQNLSSLMEKDHLKEYYPKQMAPDEKVIDRDGDGVNDDKDDCPDVAGTSLFGCPEDNGLTDTDGDGVVDFLDLCVNEPGSADNFGCPEKKVETVVTPPPASDVLFCINLMKIVNDFPNEFRSVKGSEITAPGEEDKQYNVTTPIPGIGKQYLDWVTFGSLTLYGYTGEYAIESSLESAKVKYKELLAMVNPCDLKPATWKTTESNRNDGTQQKLWTVVDYPGGLTGKYEKFAMTVEIDKSRDDNGATIYRVILGLNRVL